MDNIDAKKELFTAILKLKTIEECDIFFDDLLTKKELEADRKSVV